MKSAACVITRNTNSLGMMNPNPFLEAWAPTSLPSTMLVFKFSLVRFRVINTFELSLRTKQLFPLRGHSDDGVQGNLRSD